MKKIFPVAIICSIVYLISLYTYFAFKYAVNSPLWDDESVLSYLINILHSDDLIQKFKYIFKTHNEHIIAYSFFVFYLNKLIFGIINLKYISIYGSIFTLFTVSIIVIKNISLKKYFENWQSQLMVVGFILATVHILSWELLVWPMASILNIHATFFVVFGLYLIQTKKFAWHFIAYLLFFGASMCSFNGLLSIPLAFYLILLNRNTNTNFKKDIYLFCFLSLVIVGFYVFLRVTIPSGNISDFSIVSIFKNFGGYLRYAFIILGGLFYIKTGTLDSCFYGGLIILVVLIVVTIKYQPYKNNPTLFACLLFFLISLSMISLGRFKLGENFLYSNLRYFLHSSFLVGILFLIFCLNEKQTSNYSSIVIKIIT